MEDVVKSLFTLDRKDGYCLQLFVIPNGEVHWVNEIVIQQDDLKEGNVKATVEKLQRFLGHYKKKPLSGRITKQRVKKTSNKDQYHIQQNDNEKELREELKEIEVALQLNDREKELRKELREIEAAKERRRLAKKMNS